jgi:hypothetical protein
VGYDEKTETDPVSGSIVQSDTGKKPGTVFQEKHLTKHDPA